MNSIRLLILLLIIPICEILASNTHRLNKTFLYRHFDSKNGLSSNQISHIQQDSKGYLWLSTWKGFSRFDGKNFINFKDNDGLWATSSFKAIEFIPDHFFVQHTKGVSFFSPQRVSTKIAFPDTVRGLRIGNSLYHHNQFWVFNCLSSKSKKICHLRYDKNWGAENLIFNDTVLALSQMEINKNAYIFTENSIYQLINGNISKAGSLKNKYRSMAIDEAGTCWGFSESDSRFYKISIKNFIINEMPTSIFALDLFSEKRPDTFVVLPDNDGIVYYTNNYELIQATPDQHKSLGRSFSLIRQMLVDKEKNLWIATEEGLFNFFRLDFERIKLTFTDKSDMFWSIATFGNNRIIAGRYGFGFVELLDSIWKPISMNYEKDTKTGMEPNVPFMGAITNSKQEAWFPVWKGLVKFDKTGNTHKFPLTVTPEHLYTDNKMQDTIFAAASGGILIIHPNEKISLIGKEVGFSDFQNESIVKDKYNRFWLGSSQGPLQIFDGKKVISNDQDTTLFNVISSQKDSHQDLWFGTEKGLYYYNYTEFAKINPKQITESIDLLVNYNDSILVGIGLKKIILINHKRKPFDIQIYDEHQLGVIQNTYMIDNMGYLWFSSMYDLIKFNPLKLLNHYSGNIPMPFFSSLEMSNDNVNWDEHKHSTKSENNNLRFNFAAITYKNQDQLSFKYYLENYDTWSNATSNREAHYTNLSPGKYRLALQCSVDGQHWSPVVYSDYIEIRAAWYHIQWIRIVIIIALIIILIGVGLKINQNSNKRNIRKLTEQKNLNQLQLQLVRSKQIPHFSGNALANIEHYIFTSDLKQANKYLSRLSRLMNQTMQDADQPARTLKKELELVRLYLELEIMRFGEEIIGYQIITDKLVDENTMIPNMLLHTWVENAVRHGLRPKKGKGMILIEASQYDNILFLSVEDNGIGRKNAKQIGTNGTGSGLQILNSQFEIYNRVNETKIKMKVEDLENINGEATGTRFSVGIPRNYSFNL